MTLNCCFVPRAMEGLLGVTASDTNVGGLTVRMLEPLTEPREAEIAVVPCAKLLARPWLPVELLIAATAGLEEFQVTEVVRFETVPFLKKPVAANCSLSPSGIEGFEGDTEMESVLLVDSLRKQEVAGVASGRVEQAAHSAAAVSRA